MSSVLIVLVMVVLVVVAAMGLSGTLDFTEWEHDEPGDRAQGPVHVSF